MDARYQPWSPIYRIRAQREHNGITFSVSPNDVLFITIFSVTDHRRVVATEWVSQKAEFLSSGKKAKHSVARKKLAM